MSGDATFAGTTYQAGVIAFISVHAITGQRLGWFEFFDDTPTAIAGEVGGPGDDISADFGPSRPIVDVQAKHGLTGSSEILKLVERIQATAVGPGETRPIVLAINNTSAQWIQKTFANDLDRLRAERPGSCRPKTHEILTALADKPGHLAALRRLHIKVVDVDDADDASVKWALSELRRALTDASRAEDAWRLLCHDAEKICRDRSRRTSAELIQLLAANGITLSPPAPIARITANLDLSRSLLRRRKPHVALILLSEIEKLLKTIKPAPELEYRLVQQRAASYLQIGRSADALSLARRALEFNPRGVHALNTAALAALNVGDSTNALRFSDEAVVVDPDSSSAWAIRTLVCLTCEIPLESPPPRVAETAEYRIGFVDAVMHRGRVERASALIDELLREGHRTPEVLLFKAQALMTTPNNELSIESRQVADEVERLTTEVIDETDAPDDTVIKALLARSIARRALDRHADAQADTKRAQDLAPDEPEVISSAAQTKLADGHFEVARQLLSGPNVERYPLLIALRAQALAGLNDDNGARRDIEEALRRLPEAYEPNVVRLSAANAAVEIKDVALAELALAGLSGEKSHSASYSLVRGRIAFAKGEFAAAINEYEKAALQDDKLRAACFAELGSRLLSASRPEEAADAFSKSDPIPSKALPQYVRALILSNKFVVADTLVQKELGRGSEAAGWALEAATRISLLREDFESAATHLERLVKRGGTTPMARLQLVSLFVEMDRPSEARLVLDSLAEEGETLTPEEDMAFARGLFLLGDEEAALETAFRAYRSSQHDPASHRAFATLALNSKVPTKTESEVGLDTYVRLQNTRTSLTKEFVILSEPPWNSAAHEISVQAAEALNLMGLKVGDLTPMKDPLDQWRVVEIKSALLHAVQDILAHFEDRFPDAPFFIKGVSTGDGTGVADFAGVIATLHQGEQQAQQLVALYRQHILPLGFVAKARGVTIAAAMEYLRTDDGGGALLVEWSDIDGQQQSLAAVSQSSTVVLTESALDTTYHLGLLDVLRDRFALIAPKSLHRVVANRLSECEEMVRNGHSVLSTEGPGLRMRKWKPGDPALMAEREQVKARLSWINQNVRFESRPLESIESDDEHSTRQAIGASAFDSLALSAFKGYTLYADDLGLRRLALTQNAKSFSTPTLVAGLSESGTFAQAAAIDLLLRLISMRYAWIPMSVPLLDRMLQTMHGTTLHQALAVNLGKPTFNLENAARLAAQTLRLTAAAPIQTRSFTSLANAFLLAMNAHWPRQMCAQALARSAAQELALLPRQRDVILRACRDFGNPPEGFQQ